ncbi:MAG: Gfo/Idh/MocA family oxidoreductase [Clostridia bacterium]|nr:Gfo/Idh/MocA family oxidoreductase [Clostridia bacterium]
MNKKKLGVCIVGCGTISHTHAGAIRQNEDLFLAGVCDRNADAAKAFAENYSCAVFPSLEDACASDEVGLIAVCTPSGTHFGIASEVLSRGKNAIVEKPVALKAGQCETLRALADEKGLCCVMIAQQRYSDTAKAVKAAAESGKFGKIVLATLDMKYYRPQEYYDGSSWKGSIEQDGGVLMNQGIHGVDLMCGFLGRPKVLSASVRTLDKNIEADDAVTASVEYPCGAPGVVTCTVCAFPGYPRRIEINGTKGSVLIEENDIVRWDIEGEPPVSTLPQTKGYRDHFVSDYTMHSRQYGDVAAHILTDSPLDYSLADAEDAVSLIEEIYKYRKLK